MEQVKAQVEGERNTVVTDLSLSLDLNLHSGW